MALRIPAKKEKTIEIVIASNVSSSVIGSFWESRVFTVTPELLGPKSRRNTLPNQVKY